MISEDKIYSYFEDSHGPVSRSTHGWYEGVCPFCHSKKLAFNSEYSSVKCWKGCYKGSVIGFIKEYLGCSYVDAYTILDDQIPKIRFSKYVGTGHAIKQDIRLPDGFQSILDGKSPMGDRARKYLINRNFDLNYLDIIGVGYVSTEDKYFGYIIIPFKRDGEVVYFIGRDFLNRGDRFRYKNPNRDEFGVGKEEVLFNEEAMYLFDKVYLLEGWADAATLGNNASSIQGNTLSDTQAWIIMNSPVKKIVVVPDVGAEMKGLNIVERLYTSKRVSMLDVGTLSEHGKDVNEIGADKIFELEKSAPDIITLNDFYVKARSINPRKTQLLK